MRKEKSNLIQVFFKTFLFCLVLASLGLVGFYAWQFYQKTYREEIAIKKNQGIALKEAVEINFSVPVWNADYAKEIKIVPEEKIKLTFDQTKRKLTIMPEKFWKPDTSYSIIFPEGRTAMLTKISGKKLLFSAIGFPKIANVFPVDGAKEVVIGAEDPIVVDFDRSVEGYFIKFKLEPESEINYQISAEKKQFKILPKEGMKDGSVYGLKVFAKVKEEGDEKYQEIYAGSFETMKTVPIVWEKDLTLRLEQAKKYTKAKIVEGKYIDINLGTQIMSIFENNILLDSFLVSSGKRGMDTPTGQTQIYNKAPRPFSKAYGLYMPFWMALVSDGKRGIHELPEWPGGYKEGANHLGIPVSHGCIRLGVGPAERVYNWAEIGTPVIVY